MFMSIATYNGVGTEYELSMSDDGMTYRVTIGGGPSEPRVIREQTVNCGPSNPVAREKSIELQREMAIWMMDEALSEVRAERGNDAPRS